MKIGVNVKEQRFIVVLHFTVAVGSVTMNINLPQNECKANPSMQFSGTLRSCR